MCRYLPKRIEILILLVVISGFSVDSTLRGNEEKGKSEIKIDLLIDDLRSDRFEVREAASRALMDLVEAIPALQRARKSDDLELRLRATNILREVAKKRARRALSRAKALAKAGRIIEAADRVAYWGQLGQPGEDWEILTQFASEARSKTARYFPPHGFWYYPEEIGGHFPLNPMGEFRRYAESAHPREMAAQLIDIDAGGEELILSEKEHAERKLAVKGIDTLVPYTLLLRGENILCQKDISDAGIYKGIIAATGDVELPPASHSLVIAGGNLAKLDGTMQSIVICDGDVELPGPPSAALIVARGKVTCATGKAAIIMNCMVRSGRSLVLPDGTKVDLKDGTPDPLAFVKFFELADVGLRAEDLPKREKSTADGVRIKEMKKDSPFAAGLRSGDVITAIEERKTPTTETFRRVLRRKLARGGPTITFTVRRSDKTLGVPIAVKD
jgi:hypothetical protein